MVGIVPRIGEATQESNGAVEALVTSVAADFARVVGAPLKDFVLHAQDTTLWAQMHRPGGFLALRFVADNAPQHSLVFAAFTAVQETLNQAYSD